MMKKNRLYLSTALSLLNLSAISATIPMFIELKKRQEKCIYYDIPPGSDAHLGFVIMHANESDVVRTYMLSMLKNAFLEDGDVGHILRAPLPKEILDHTDEDLRSKDVVVDVEDPEMDIVYDQNLGYLSPAVVKNLKKYSHHGFADGDDDDKVDNHEDDDFQDDDYEVTGLYHICAESQTMDETYHLLFYAAVADEIKKEKEIDETRRDLNNKNKVKKVDAYNRKELEPIQRSISAAEALAKGAVRDWDHLEKRGNRMRQTVESTQSRIQALSWISLAVVISVTIGQILYLKNYFTKKKLL